MTQINQDSYNFESFREPKENNSIINDTTKGNNNKRKSHQWTVVIVISILLGWRWRYSFGGKLVLLNLILNLTPYWLLFRNKVDKPRKITTFYLLIATIFSFSVAGHGYLTQSTGKLTFSRESIELPQNSQYQLEVHSQRFGSTIPKLNIRTSNENVVSVPKWGQYLEIKDIGNSRIKVFDDYGNKVEFDVISTLSVPEKIYTHGSTVIKKGEKALLSILSTDNQQMKVEMNDNPIVSASEFYYYGLQEGTVPFTARHKNYPTLYKEFTVISKEDYAFNLCEDTLCEQFSVGDKIDVQSLIPKDATNIHITSDSSLFNQAGNEVTAIKPGFGFITVAYDDITYFLMIQVRETNLESVIVSDFDGTLMIINQKRNMGIRLSPSYTRFERMIYTSSNPSVATVDEDGEITPLMNGYTFIDVTIDDISVTVPVKVEL